MNQNTNAFAAMESLFQSSFDEEVAKVSENVSRTCQTMDDCLSAISVVDDLAGKYNQCLDNLNNNYAECKEGLITKDEAKKNIAMCIKSLQVMVKAMRLEKHVNITENDCNPDDVAKLKQFLSEYKRALEERLAELRSCGDDKCVYVANKTSAMESDGAGDTIQNMLFDKNNYKLKKELKGSNKVKTANALYAQARKLYSIGSKTKAYEHLSRAKGLYEDALKEADKYGKFRDSKKKVISSVASDVGGHSTSETFKNRATDSRSFATYYAWIEDRIISCIALEKQWNNKAGKASFTELKKALKKEHKVEKLRGKLNKRLEKES